MNTDEFIEHMNQGISSIPGTPIAATMNELAEEAIRLCMELNTRYTTPEERREIMSSLTGRTVPASFRIFPPFTTDCGKNIHIGDNVFINSGCRFQDQGGIYLGNNVLIGHNVVLATLNHDLNASTRGTTLPRPITIGDDVWVGANATILPGVTIGARSIVAAGAVVTRDVLPDTIVGGVPARTLKNLSPAT